MAAAENARRSVSEYKDSVDESPSEEELAPQPKLSNVGNC